MSATNVNSAINLRLALLGQPLPADVENSPSAQLVAPILARQREQNRRLADRLSPVDQRIQSFLDSYLGEAESTPQLPRRTLVLDQAGLARGLSLPQDGDEFSSDLLSSYRLMNGVLHNPANDRRTTAGVFHIAEGGLPIPDDKIAVERDVFARLLRHAFEAPEEALRLPFTANTPTPAACFVSLLLRPVVVPEVPGITNQRTMEIRFIVPGGMVANLDFVESIFGNGGDPYLPENDASLEPSEWTGHTGCVILAPHLTKMTKKELGLPHVDDATDRQRRDGQCWSDPDERYNNGQAFKLCARDERGVIVTIIADNYFGYCKKEVKTQISYSANLLGCAEEEHAGGAVVYPAYNLGAEFTDNRTPDGYTLASVVERDPHRFTLNQDGSVSDKLDDAVVIVPGGATFSMRTQTITWDDNGSQRTIKLLANKTYFLPNGYRVFAKHREEDRTQWHLVGVAPNATHCHKPATVSGGGKSEISKSLLDAFVFGTAFIGDFDEDMAHVESIINGDYSNRFADASRNGTDHRPVLSAERSLGSVIKLLTPSSRFTAEHNDFLRSIPPHIKELVFTIKRYYQPEWGEDWRDKFSVGIMNGRQGNSLRLHGERIIANFLRVGFETDGSWRLFSLRPDFSPASKVQTEDDITASTVAPSEGGGVSRKYVQNCEQLLFQRPDDAIYRGYDKQTEKDMARPDTFISNFQPLTHADAREMLEDVQAYSEFTEPMAELIQRAAETTSGDSTPRYFVCSANPRLVNGKPSKNPRYLQVRPDLSNPAATARADLASHLFLKIGADQPNRLPVDVVAAGRRNNPADEGVPPLCSYNPLHYMELPELFMEFISSMTGKSPSTTGAGSEGAMTKGPFNALPATIDLNSAFLSFALTGYDGWLSSAGYIGPNVRVNHDISLLVPELFCRMSEDERSAETLIRDGYLERMQDFEHNGEQVLASRLGYRINEQFATTYFGRIFLHPDMVFTDEMLRPEIQDVDTFAESMATIVKTHQRVAKAYFDDGTVELAIPPLRALLEVMANGKTEDGLTLDDEEFRTMFTRESVLASDWYAARLAAKQAEDVQQVRTGLMRMDAFTRSPENLEAAGRLNLGERIASARAELKRLQSADYLKGLKGTVGRQSL
ncbi:hypothetical protein [Nigerium massiliense]|uniref:hypothetical protein n=1 Tax=Nigerium massiliense TaxID=1522317 RepID=UPI0005913218|nr:hypothetical protein [Nigerium massiliense]